MSVLFYYTIFFQFSLICRVNKNIYKMVAWNLAFIIFPPLVGNSFKKYDISNELLPWGIRGKYSCLVTSAGSLDRQSSVVMWWVGWWTLLLLCGDGELLKAWNNLGVYSVVFVQSQWRLLSPLLLSLSLVGSSCTRPAKAQDTGVQVYFHLVTQLFIPVLTKMSQWPNSKEMSTKMVSMWALLYC